MRTLLFLLLTFTVFQSLSAQTGGEGIFNFLQLTCSAKTAALGGTQIALPDADPELLLQNPALLSIEMDHTISVNYAKYLAGIGFGYGTYARNLGKYGMAAIGVQFVDYGQFVAADENGLITGTFSASDYALTLSYAKKIGNLFTVGANLKPVYSHLENYKSFGIAGDVGVFRLSEDKLTSFALCVKNVGKQLTTYYEGGEREKIVWSLQIGYTHRLQYAPIRLSVTAYELNNWSPEVANTDPEVPATASKNISPASAVMRHLSLGAEIFPENKVTFRVGYNYRRHADLMVADQSGMAGFTTGLGIKLAAFHLNYALSGYYQSGIVHNFSLTANLAQLK